MSYKISKELFEAVMDKKVTTEISISPYYNEINGCEEGDLILINYNFIWIPLDTFFFKCKKYALEQGYDIIVVEIDGKYKILTPDCWQEHRLKSEMVFVVSETFAPKDSEQQAVFDACQWILNNKDKQ